MKDKLMWNYRTKEYDSSSENEDYIPQDAASQNLYLLLTQHVELYNLATLLTKALKDEIKENNNPSEATVEILNKVDDFFFPETSIQHSDKA